MKLPPITAKQQEILKQLYRYRFITRTQLQAGMGHKDKRRISAWLKDLREKQYIEWIYSADDFVEKSKPAVYYFGLIGIRYLKTLGTYPIEELRKRYKESTRKQAFISKCILIADCCVHLETRSIEGVRYNSIAEADYTDPENTFHFLHDLRPDLYFAKHETIKHEVVITNYLLEVFDASLPKYMVKKRFKDYTDFLDTGEWQKHTKYTEPPIVLLAYQTDSELAYAKRRMRILLENVPDELHSLIRFSTIEKMKVSGVTGIVWEEI